MHLLPFYCTDENDFVQVTPVSDIAPGVDPTRQCVTVSIQNDMISEETESFTLSLSYRENLVTVYPYVTEIFIVDNDGTHLLL